MTSHDLSSTSPAQERSDELASGNWNGHSQKTQNQHQKRHDNRDSDDRLRDLLEWLEEFTDNQEDTEVHAPAHYSQDSDSERPAKLVSNTRKHSVYTHVPKDRNCAVCFRTNMTRVSLQKTHWRTSTLSRLVW